MSNFTVNIRQLHEKFCLILAPLIRRQAKMHISSIDNEIDYDCHIKFIYAFEKVAGASFFIAKEWLELHKINNYFTLAKYDNVVAIRLKDEYINNKSLDKIYTLRKLVDGK